MNDYRLEYIDWLVHYVGETPITGYTYERLIGKLFDTVFRWSIHRDENRALDGLALRRGYSFDMVLDHEEANVLEVLVAMAIRCEEDIMQDSAYGDRTGEWFWTMIYNLGLLDYDDLNYDDVRVTEILDIFMDREFSPDGHGSIFYVHHVTTNMRNVELWYQMMWYLNEHFNFDIY